MATIHQRLADEHGLDAIGGERAAVGAGEPARGRPPRPGHGAARLPAAGVAGADRLRPAGDVARPGHRAAAHGVGVRDGAAVLAAHVRAAHGVDGSAGVDRGARGGVRVLRRGARPAGAGQPEDRGRQARSLRPEDQPLVCGAGRALRHAGRPGAGVQAQGQAAGGTPDALCSGLVLAGPGVLLAARRCAPPRWSGASMSRGRGRVARWTGAAPAAVFDAVERDALAGVADRDRSCWPPGRPRGSARTSTPPSRGRSTRCRGGTSGTGSTSAPPSRWCSCSTTGSWSRPTRARTAGSRPTWVTTRRRRSPSTCAPRPGAAAKPLGIGPACVVVIDELLADNALFRLRAAQGVIGLADKHNPAGSRRPARRPPRRGIRPTAPSRASSPPAPKPPPRPGPAVTPGRRRTCTDPRSCSPTQPDLAGATVIPLPTAAGPAVADMATTTFAPSATAATALR